MFPIFTTALALILCLVGADLLGEGAEIAVSPLSSLLLLIIPTGEILLLLVKRKKSLFTLKILRVISGFFSAYPLVAFAVAVLTLGWTRFPAELGLDTCLVLEKGLLIVSYMALTNITRFYRNRFARAMNILPPDRGFQELVLAVKGEVTVVIPFMIFLLFNDFLSLSERLTELFGYLPVLFWSGLFFVFLGTAYIMPRIIRIVWGLKPLPRDSARRHALLRFMDQQDFKARDILRWPTGGLLVNAAIIGLTGGSRYIIFTDAMLKHLTVSELEAVMAHEVGHGKRRHLFIYLMFSAAFVFGVSLLENFLTPMGDLLEELEQALPFVGPAVLFYWWIAFGFLSRRFEMEADIYGADAIRNPALFMHTLDKVARMGGVTRSRKSWRHFSIDRRISSLMKVFLENPVAAVLFWRKMKRIRIGLAAFSLVLFLLFSADMAGDSLAGMGLLAMKDRDYEAAEKHLRTASRLPGGERHRWSLVTLYLKANRTDQADELLTELTASMESGESPDYLKPLMTELALAFLEQNRGNKSRAILRRAKDLFPEAAEWDELDERILLYIQGDPEPLKVWLEDKNRGEETDEKIPFLIPGGGEKEGVQR